MRYGVDFTISNFKRRRHGNYRGDHGSRRNLKSKHFNVEYVRMHNKFACNLATVEGKKKYQRLYARELRRRKNQQKLEILPLLE